jgi:V8-like Glu-specific endopeptidase
MRNSPCIALTTALWLACSPQSEESPEVRQQAIVRGTVDPGDPAVMEMFGIAGTKTVRCTVTLVTPRVVLSAAHCVRDAGRTAKFGIFPGGDDRKVTGKDLLPTTAAVADPAYPNDPNDGHDIGLIVLATPLKIAPVPINRAPLTNAVGKQAKMIGYGLTDGVAFTGDGIKRFGTAPIAEVTNELIRIGKNPQGTCHGDSGGPLLMDNGSGEALIGVVSFGDSNTCVGNSYFERLDTQMAWVDEQIKKYDPTGAPADGGAEPPTSDAAPDTTEPPEDAGLPDRANIAPSDAAVPAVRLDATPRRSDAGVPPGDDEPSPADAGGSRAANAGSGCALAPADAHTPGGMWLAGAIVAGACLARRRRGSAHTSGQLIRPGQQAAK